jgi:DNA-binding CsgD family transcriptional regulator
VFQVEKLKCPQCGKEFEKNSNNHKFCSEYCGKRYRQFNGEHPFNPQKVSKEDLDEIKRLYESGITKKQIYEQFDINKETLNKYLRRILNYESHILRNQSQVINKTQKEQEIYKSKKPRIITDEQAEKYIKTILTTYINPCNPEFINSLHISVLYDDLGYYYADGKSSKEIAELLDLPQDIVKKTFKYLPNTDFYADRESLKHEENQKLNDLVKYYYECGMSGRETIEKTGSTRSSISRKFKELDFTDSREIRERKHYEELKNIYDMYINGYTQKAIENKTGLSIKQIELRMRNFRKLTPTDELEKLEKSKKNALIEEDWEKMRNAAIMGEAMELIAKKHGKGRCSETIENGLISRYGTDYKYRS